MDMIHFKMDILDDFYIIATYPYNYCWNYKGELSNVHLDTFIYKKGYICSSDEVFYMKIKDDSVCFVNDKSDASQIQIEQTSISVNYHLKYKEKFIRHRNNRLYCEEFTGTVEFKKDATWIFYPKHFDPDHTFVIARFKENINWIRCLPGKVIVYNKGFPMTSNSENILILNIPNIGREGHTYLYHIIQNYDKLTERTTFLQADPFPHSPHLLELTCMVQDYEDMQPLSVWYINTETLTIPSKETIKKYYDKLNGAYFCKYKVDKSGQFFHYHDKGYDDMIKKYMIDNSSDKNVLDHFLKRCGLDSKIKEKYTMFFSALFSVKKDNILDNSLEDYKTIFFELIKNNSQGGAEGFMLERLWYEILR